MCDYIKEFTCFADLTKQAKELLSKSDKPVEQSKLYSNLTETKYLDPKERNSVYRIFTDKEYFNLVEKYIVQLNTLDDMYSYKLVRSDITHIIYEECGFFKRHEDYLSLTTNCLEEYSMIIYLNSDVVGGETVFHLNKFMKHVSTPEEGKVVIFRKDIEHEGNVVTSGRKEILTANIWAIPRRCDQCVVVSFRDDTRTYCFPLANVMAFENMIHSYITFCNLQGDKIVNYLSDHITYEEFRPVADVFQRCYISDIERSIDTLDYYQIPKNRILISDKNQTFDNEWTMDDDIIICTEAECTVLQDKLPDQNYVKFQILFVEGTMTYGKEIADSSTTTIDLLSPAWVTIGNKQQVLALHSLVTGDYPTLDKKTIYDVPNYDRLVGHNDPVMMTSEDEDEDEDEPDALNALKCIDPENCYFSVPGLVLSADGFEFEDVWNYLSKGDDRLSLKFEEFDVDPRKTVMRLKELDLVDVVTNMVRKKKMNFPQMKNSLNHSFCNESVYGNFTMVMVSGLFRIAYSPHRNMAITP